MKYVMILLFVPMIGFGQNDTLSIQKCGNGYSWFPTIGTTSLMIIADTCLPDSVCKELWLEYKKNLCGEGSIFMSGGMYQYYHSSTWINDSIGCVAKDSYEKKVNGRWVEISKCRYYYENKGVSCYDFVNGRSIKVSCCGHIHKSLPL